MKRIGKFAGDAMCLFACLFSGFLSQVGFSGLCVIDLLSFPNRWLRFVTAPADFEPGQRLIRTLTSERLLHTDRNFSVRRNLVRISFSLNILEPQISVSDQKCSVGKLFAAKSRFY